MTHQAEPSPSAAAPVLYFSAYDSRCAPDFYCLHRSGMDGSSPELLGTLITPRGVTWRPAASPDGSRVAFVTSGPIIRVFDYATKTVSGWSVAGQYASWSPDGSRIAYIPSFGGVLRVVNADGTNQRLVGPSDRTYVDGPISWSSDSKWLLARRNLGPLDLVEVETGIALPLPYALAYYNASLK
jgi:WD40 repeat protein